MHEEGAPPAVSLRPGEPGDALCLSVLAMQVFLDTYATHGIRPAIAREALSANSKSRFAKALEDPATRIHVAESDGHLAGFAQIKLGAQHELAPAGKQSELLRLYIQQPFAGRRVGTLLLEKAELLAAEFGSTVIWLTAWVHNHHALQFYARRGYLDHGLDWFRFGGESHANRLYAKVLLMNRG